MVYARGRVFQFRSEVRELHTTMGILENGTPQQLRAAMRERSGRLDVMYVRGGGLSGLVEVGGLHQENAEPALLSNPVRLRANGTNRAGVIFMPDCADGCSTPGVELP